MIENIDNQKENRLYPVESDAETEAESKVDRFAGTLFHPDNTLLYRKHYPEGWWDTHIKDEPFSKLSVDEQAGMACAFVSRVRPITYPEAPSREQAIEAFLEEGRVQKRTVSRELDIESRYLFVCLNTRTIHLSHSPFQLPGQLAAERFKEDVLTDEKLSALFEKHFSNLPEDENKVIKRIENIIRELFQQATTYFNQDLLRRELESFFHFNKWSSLGEDLVTESIDKIMSTRYKRLMYKFSHSVECDMYRVIREIRTQLKKKNISLNRSYSEKLVDFVLELVYQSSNS